MSMIFLIFNWRCVLIICVHACTRAHVLKHCYGAFSYKSKVICLRLQKGVTITKMEVFVNKEGTNTHVAFMEKSPQAIDKIQRTSRPLHV